MARRRHRRRLRHAVIGALALPVVLWTATDAAAPVTHPTADASRTAAPSDPATTWNSSAASDTWAVVVGIDDYTAGPEDLSYAREDALDVVAALDRFGAPATQRRVLLDRAATGSAIRETADWLAASAASGDKAVLFYAGHVASDGRDRQEIVGSDDDRVSDADLASRLAPLAADQTWIAIAGCYGGGFTELLAPGRTLTAAAPIDQEAFENDAYERSYLVQWMVREAWLDGRAAPTVEAAFAYAADRAAAERPDRAPLQIDGVPGDLAFATP